ncbi:hypothetical protein [Stutzerimonas stutzeri]|uniref:hypothetical protein n=1 Tax=Stutzerimonas stutzeri TaxID=316 RepID=UPI0011155867|nr:hypothetical protein [Stutzerimonas stutzeri]
MDEHVDLTTDAMQHLSGYGWRGNARRLNNPLCCAVALADNGMIGLDCLPQEVQSVLAERTSVAQSHTTTRDARPNHKNRAGETFGLLQVTQVHRLSMGALKTVLAVVPPMPDLRTPVWSPGKPKLTAATTVASWRQGKGRIQAARSPSVCGAAIEKALPEQQDSGLRVVSGA